MIQINHQSQPKMVISHMHQPECRAIKNIRGRLWATKIIQNTVFSIPKESIHKERIMRISISISLSIYIYRYIYMYSMEFILCTYVYTSYICLIDLFCSRESPTSNKSKNIQSLHRAKIPGRDPNSWMLKRLTKKPFMFKQIYQFSMQK